MHLFRRLLLLLLSSLLACQSPQDGIVTPTDPIVIEPVGVVYEKGLPDGQVVQKVIGPEGGQLTSTDNTLRMTIPAGAVSQQTVFSMQPVTPTLPGLIGKHAYRLLPEGLPFARPVTLQFQYQPHELDGTSAQALFMAYQGSDGIWKALPSTELDETTQTLTVNTTHFSDWGAFAEFSLEADRSAVKPGESAKLTLATFLEDFVKDPLGDMLDPLTSERKEIFLTQRAVLRNPDNIKNWRVTGLGIVQPDASLVQATYSAPGDAVGGEAVVAVDIYNFLPPKRRPRKGATGKATILKTIQIEGNSFEASWGGQTYMCQAVGFVDQRGVTISANIAHPNGEIRPLMVLIRTKQLKASANYLYDYEGKGGSVDVLLGEGKDAWVAYVDPCVGNEVINSSGSVHIESVDGNTVRGSMTANLYLKEDCEFKKRSFTAKFKLTLIED
jgi:hypothetical protein